MSKAKLPPLPKTSGYEPDCDYPKWIRELLTQYGQGCAAAAIADMRPQINALKASIAQIGEMANVCTYNDIKEVCSYCRCKRAPAPKVEQEGK